MFSLLLIWVFAISTAAGEGDDPPGHMQPIGSHQPPLLVTALSHMPNPIEFFEEYVKPSKPVIFKEAAKKFPSFDSWKNDQYLSEKFGSWRVVAEEGKKENRSMGMQEMSLRKFIKVYNESDIYLVEDVIPPNKMAKEVYLPKCLLCGGYTDQISTAVMWFSSGGTKSVLHNDQYENINCLYDGFKELFMVDQKLHEDVPIDIKEGSYSSVDVEKVDMYKYPTLSNITWYQANMEAGDCMYIPSKWFHHVNSSNTRNLAINIWWNFMYELPKREDCEKNLQDLPEHKPITDFKLADPSESSRVLLFHAFDPVNRTVSKEQFMLKMPEVMFEDGSEFDKEIMQKELLEIFGLVDKDKDDILTAQEVYEAPANVVRMLGTEYENFSAGYESQQDHQRYRDEL